MIQRRKRKLATLVAAAFTTAMLVPLTAGATIPHQITQDPITLTEESGGCPGHTISGKTGGPNANTIHVVSGTHDITFDGLEIVSEACAFSIDPRATVNLYLKGENSLTSGGAEAGIFVPVGATLNIDSASNNPGDSLKVISSEGAGIGGRSGTLSDNIGAGKITINGGTVTAKGGSTGAGIGGCRGGGAGDIKISGQNTRVTATGGVNGGPGIGCGATGSGGTIEISGGLITANGGSTANNSVGAAGIGRGANGIGKVDVKISDGTVTATGGNVTNFNGPGGPGIGGNDVEISGGNVTAIGGANDAKDDTRIGPQGKSLDCNSLSSGSGENVIITANGDIPPLENIKRFNGIIQNGNNYTVLGNATWHDPNHDNALHEGQSINLTTGSSLILKENLTVAGKIGGTGTLVNADKAGIISPGEINLTQDQKKVSLIATDITIKPDQVYNGTDQADTIIQWAITRGEYSIDLSGWSTRIINQNGEDTNGKLINADSYTIYFSKPGYDGFEKEATISPKPLSDSMLTPIANENYTGSEVEPDIQLSDGDTKLVEGKDFEVTYEGDRVDVQSDPVKVTITGKGNYTGTLESSFTIIPTSIENATVKADLTDAVYDGNKKSPTIAVFFNNGTLKPENFKVIYSPGDLINAGTVTVTVEGLGNYQGSAEGEFEIEKRPLTIVEATAETSKEFDGTPAVKLTDVKLDSRDFVTGDEADVQVDTSNLTGDVSSANVGEDYTSVSIKEVPLTGNKAGNYIVTPKDDVSLTDKTAITKANPAKPILGGSPKENDKGTGFNFTVIISNKAPGVEYEYRTEGDSSWQDGDSFRNLEPGKVYTFEARAKGNKNVNESEIGSTGKITMPKLDQDPPDPFVLEYEANSDGTFTATIPEIKGAEYSFDNKNFSDQNTKTDCAPNTQYTGYARFPEDDTHNASPSTASTETSPKLTAEAPVISPDGGKFAGSRKVTITCPTEGVKIYYTTDGSDPSSSSTEYTDAFTIDTALTVKAIAVRDDLNDSKVTSAEFEKVAGDGVQSKWNIQNDIPGVPESFNDPEVLNKWKEKNGWDLSSIDGIKAALISTLSAHNGYTHEHIAIYDITAQISLDGENWEDATVDNFPDEGVTIVIPYPEGTGKDSHDFIAAHMFTAFSERLGTEPGQIEEPVVTRVDEGLQFTVMGTSPVGIAWRDLAQGGNNPDSNDPNDPTNQNQQNTDPQNQNQQNQGNVSTQANPNSNTTSTKASDAKSDNKSASDVVSSVLPKTGDPMSFLPWIAAIVICLIVVIGIVNKKKR